MSSLPYEPKYSMTNPNEPIVHLENERIGITIGDELTLLGTGKAQQRFIPSSRLEVEFNFDFDIRGCVKSLASRDCLGR